MEGTKLFIILCLGGAVVGQFPGAWLRGRLRHFPRGPFTRLDGTVHPCDMDCRSFDSCVAGHLGCETTDGRQAYCRRCRCIHHYLVYEEEVGWKEALCADGRNSNQLPKPEADNEAVQPQPQPPSDVSQLKPFSKLNGEMEECRTDCYSADTCAGQTCTSTDGRTAACIRCMCVHYYVAMGTNGPEQVSCSAEPDMRRTRMFGTTRTNNYNNNGGSANTRSYPGYFNPFMYSQRLQPFGYPSPMRQTGPLNRRGFYQG